MAKYLLLILLFICVLIFTGSSGCTRNLTDNSPEKVSSMEESRQSALEYVRNLESYRTFNLTEPVIIETRSLDCTSCWRFVYEFDLVSEKDPSVIDTARVTVTVSGREVNDAVYVQGSRQDLQLSEKITDQPEQKENTEYWI